MIKKLSLLLALCFPLSTVIADWHLPTTLKSRAYKPIFHSRDVGMVMSPFNRSFSARQANSCQAGFFLCPDQTTACCPTGATCCTLFGEGGCCAGNDVCIESEGTPSCCPIGEDCSGPPTGCSLPGYDPCPGNSFCCPTGDTCTTDVTGAPACSAAGESSSSSSTHMSSIPPDTTASPSSSSTPPGIPQPGTSSISSTPSKSSQASSTSSTSSMTLVTSQSSSSTSIPSITSHSTSTSTSSTTSTPSITSQPTSTLVPVSTVLTTSSTAQPSSTLITTPSLSSQVVSASDHTFTMSFPAPDSGGSNVQNSTVSATDPRISYSGSSWAQSSSCDETSMKATSAGDSLTFQFIGTAIFMNTVVGSNAGTFSVAVDNSGDVADVDGFSTTSSGCQISWSAFGLSNSLHTIIVTFKGASPKANSGSASTAFELGDFIVTTVGASSSGGPSNIGIKPRSITWMRIIWVFGATTFAIV